MDPVNYLVNSRMNTELKEGDVITPVYDITYVGTGSGDSDDGKKTKKIVIRKRSKISSEKLPDGYYLNSAVISDYRGDIYYSQVVGNTVSGGKVSERKTDNGFIGRE